MFFSSRISFDVDRNLLRKVPTRHGFGHVGNVTYLAGEVTGHEVHAVGEILPRSGDVAHVRLSAEFSFRPHLTRHAGHFRRKRAKLIHHRVDRVLQLQDFSAHVDRDLLGEVAIGHCRRHFGDISHLTREISGHEIHAVGEVFPGASRSADIRLAPEFSFGTDFASHTGDFCGERAKLIHHRIDRILQLQDFSAHVDRDLLREVPIRHGSRHFGDVAHLTSEVTGHEVHAIREILPGTGHAADIRLAPELSFRTDFACHTRDFRGERAELIHHRVDRILQLQDFSAHVHRDLLERSPFATAVVTSAMLRTWPVRFPAMKFTLSVRSFQVPATPFHFSLSAELSFRSYLAGDTGNFRGK